MFRITSMCRVASLVVVVTALGGLCLAACGKTSRGAPSGVQSTTAGGAECRSADDCAISCYSDADDCCGDACGCEHPYTKSAATALEAQRGANCANKKPSCKQARCVVKRLWPGCANGRCIGVPGPARTECSSDADCALAPAREGSCCPGCDATAWSTSELRAHEAWAKQQCAGASCPRLDCPQLAQSVARCKNGQCVAEVASTGKPTTPEEIVVDHYLKKGWGKPAKLVPYPHVPYLYRAEFADGQGWVLVHHGEILAVHDDNASAGKGLDALAAYMKDAALLSERHLDRDDLLTLILLFGAYPPAQPNPQGFYDSPEQATLRPKLTLGSGEGSLVLSYLIPRPPEAVSNAKVITLSRYTLKLPKDYALAWHGEVVNFDTKK